MSRFKKAQADARAKTENENLGPSAPVVELPTNPLVWEHWTQKNELKMVDLTMYRDGSDEIGIIGRPRLILELAPIIRSDTYGKSLVTLEKKLGYIFKFFKFLAEIQREQGRDIISCRDLTSADGHGFKQYLLGKPGKYLKEKRNFLNYVRKCADNARLSGGDPNLLRWPTIELPKDIEEHRDVEPRALKAVNNAAKRGHDDSLKQHERGMKALQLGTDPRTISQTGKHGSTRGRKGGQRNMGWYNWRNILVLLCDRIRQRIIDGENIDQSDVKRIGNTLSRIERWASDKGWKDRGWPTPTVDTLYRMIAPSVDDTMAAHALVTYHTGWMDTARAITVVDENYEESDDWYSDRTGLATYKQDKHGSVMVLSAVEESVDNDEDTVDIGAVRPKTKRLHSALSLKNSRYHPYSVIKAQIDRTRFLRGLLREVRVRLLAEPQTSEIRAEIALVERKLRSPWIYYNKNGKGHGAVGLLGESQDVSQAFNNGLKPHAIEWARRQNDDALVESIDALRPGDIRDGYAAFVYNASGSDIFAVQGMLNHLSSETTRHYLRQKHQIKELFRKHCVLAGAVLRETADGRSVDPTVLRIDTTTKGITEADRKALETYRVGKGFRGQFGMGCNDPFNPPATIDPDHIAGTICKAQQCLLCKHSIFIPDALDPLADRCADLRELRRTLPPRTFETSSFVVELEGIEMIRAALRDEILAQDFDNAVATRTEALRSGETFVFEDIRLSDIEGSVDENSEKDRTDGTIS